jgi:hypothetical protein
MAEDWSNADFRKMLDLKNSKLPQKRKADEIVHMPSFRVDGLDYSMLAQSRAQIRIQQQLEEEERKQKMEQKIEQAALELAQHAEMKLGNEPKLKLMFAPKGFQRVLQEIYREEESRRSKHDLFLPGRVTFRFNSSAQDNDQAFVGRYTRSIEDCPSYIVCI